MSSSIPSHVTSVEMSVSFTTNASMKSSNNSSVSAVSTPSSLVTGSGMSGLLNSRNLVQDEKLAVATLATLQSGSASTLIKQDLKWIIQSRRRAEGKSEIQVEFKKPIKDELTSEEVVKRARRRELNRLAARRSRERGQRKKDRLVEEICQLQSQNRELIHVLGSLTDERDSIIETLRQHMKQCADHNATRHAATGLSQNILEKIGLTDVDKQSQLEMKEVSLSSTSHLYIRTSPDIKFIAGRHSPPLQRGKTAQTHSFSSCPSSPVVVGFSGKPLILDDTLHTGPSATTVMPSVSSLDSNSPPSSTTSSFRSPSPIGSTSSLDSHVSSDVDQRLLPPPPLPPPPLSAPHQITQRQRNSSHTFEQDYPHPASDVDSSDYKFTRPASPVSRPHHRVSLERSFSFPSTHRETRVDFTPGMRFTSSVDSDRLDSSHVASGPFFAKLDEQEAPLDLVVRNKSLDLSRNEESFSSFRDDKNPVRRRSVDDVMYQSYREPLNLTRDAPPP